MTVEMEQENAKLLEEVLSLRKALQSQQEETQKVNLELQDRVHQLTDLHINEMKVDWGDLMDLDDKDNEILTLKKANQALSEKNFELEKTLTEKQEELMAMKENLPEYHESKLSSEIETLKCALHVQQKAAAEASKQLQDRDKMVEQLKTSAQLKMADSSGHWSRRVEVLKQQVQATERNDVCIDSQAQIKYLQTQINSLQDLLQSEREHVGALQRQLLDERQNLAKLFHSHNKAIDDYHAQWDERWSTREKEMMTFMSNLQSQHEQRMNGLIQEQQEAEKLKEREMLEKTKLKDVKKEEKEKTERGNEALSFLLKLLPKPHSS